MNMFKYMAYFKIHYLSYIWLIGLICAVVLLVNHFIERRKLINIEKMQEKRKLEQNKLLHARKINN